MMVSLMPPYEKSDGNESVEGTGDGLNSENPVWITQMSIYGVMTLWG